MTILVNSGPILGAGIECRIGHNPGSKQRRVSNRLSNFHLDVRSFDVRDL